MSSQALTFFLGLILFADAEEGRYDGAKFAFGGSLILLNARVRVASTRVEDRSKRRLCR